VAAENLHITLAFLGDVPAETIVPLSASIGRETRNTRPFKLPFARLHPVPNARRANMLWASYDDPDGECAALANAVGAACASFGIALEDRAFKAHVTLARTRRARHLGDAATQALSCAEPTVPAFVSVASATLFASTLTKAGPRYEVLDTWEYPG